MTHADTTTEPGWRPDPSGRYEWRYWDGGWTSRVANSAPSEEATSWAASTSPAPPPAPPMPPSAPAASPVSSGPAVWEPMSASAPAPVLAPWEVVPAATPAPWEAAATAPPPAPTPPPAPAPPAAAWPEAPIAAPAPFVASGTSSEAWWEAASAPTTPDAANLLGPRGPTSPDLTAREPFGATVTTAGSPAADTETIAKPKRKRTGSRIGGFFRSFGDQPDSYQTVPVIWPDEPEVGGESIVAVTPGNYGRIGLVVLAAAGMLAGAYLPWIKGTLGVNALQKSGVDLGHGSAYGLGACALAVAALLTVRVPAMRWITMAIALVFAGFVARDLIQTYDLMKSMNVAAAMDVNVGTGLWIVVCSAAIGMIAAFRLTEDQKIV